MLSMWSCAATASVGDDELRELWRQGDLPRMEQIAQSGDVRAQRWMGLMLHNRGRHDEAIHWYGQAVDQGDGYSADSIAFFYEVGVGRPKDIEVATKWFRKGAVLGHAVSQRRYAAALRSGTGVERNEREAFRWYSKAAAHPDYGDAGYAYLPLAEMLLEGRVVPRDLKRSYALARAAEYTVDDSDTESQKRARSVADEAAARMPPPDLAVAEAMFKRRWPELAQQSLRPINVITWIVVAILVGFFSIFLLKRR